MTCPECGAEMRPLFTGVYCPEEDRHGQTPTVGDLRVSMQQPIGLWIDDAGDMWVRDAKGHRVKVTNVGSQNIRDLCRELGLPQPDSVWDPFPYAWTEDTD